MIRRHNIIVDESNNNSGCSVLQAVTRAQNSTRHYNNNNDVTHHIRDTDKEYKVFDEQEDAILYGEETLRIIFKKRFKKGDKFEAPKELQVDGKNPSSDVLFNRMWGICAKKWARMIPTDDNKWCVYWRPSMIKKG
jgi:hypothetical protein